MYSCKNWFLLILIIIQINIEFLFSLFSISLQWILTWSNEFSPLVTDRDSSVWLMFNCDYIDLQWVILFSICFFFFVCLMNCLLICSSMAARLEYNYLFLLSSLVKLAREDRTSYIFIASEIFWKLLCKAIA